MNQISDGQMQTQIREQMQQLAESALEAKRFSYSPYSKFQVGAALLCKDGSVYTGCNIENAAFGPTNCAERTAFFKAVSEGKKEFAAIAIAGGRAGEEISEYTYPCGVCRQVMAEFCKSDFKILVVKSKNDYKMYTLEELVPHRFGPDSLQ